LPTLIGGGHLTRFDGGLYILILFFDVSIL
jgi:hypothetical protein